jgi:hypothetical protein
MSSSQRIVSFTLLFWLAHEFKNSVDIFKTISLKHEHFFLAKNIVFKDKKNQV